MNSLPIELADTSPGPQGADQLGGEVHPTSKAEFDMRPRDGVLYGSYHSPPEKYILSDSGLCVEMMDGASRRVMRCVARVQ